MSLNDTLESSLLTMFFFSFLIQKGGMAKYFCYSECSNWYEEEWLFNDCVKD